jgi:hypothetical protein
VEHHLYILLECAETSESFLRNIMKHWSALMILKLIVVITVEILFLATTGKSCQECSKVKVLLIVAFDYETVVHHVYVPQSQTVSQHFC